MSLVIGLSAGHCRQARGAEYRDGALSISEWDLNRPILDALVPRLEDDGIIVVESAADTMTFADPKVVRRLDGTVKYLSPQSQTLNERVAHFNKIEKIKVVIDMHFNSFIPPPLRNRVEMIYSDADVEARMLSVSLAQSFRDVFGAVNIELDQKVMRDSDTPRSEGFLRMSKHPAVISEPCFLNDPVIGKMAIHEREKFIGIVVSGYRDGFRIWSRAMRELSGGQS